MIGEAISGEGVDRAMDSIDPSLDQPGENEALPFSNLVSERAQCRNVSKPCRQDGCSTPATFAIFASGYPAAMAVTCERHIGSVLLSDMSNPGSTEEWKVKVGSWVQ